MSRIIIRIEEVVTNPPGQGALVRPYEPANVPLANKFQWLDCNVSVPPFADLASQKLGDADLQGNLVRDVGAALYERLSVHPGVKAALDMIPNAPLGDSCPVYLQMTTPVAEALPFEALFVPNHRFLALDDRSPIVRVTMEKATTGVIERLCEVPLRATAVISAAERHIYEEEEWRALYQAFSESSLDFRLQVLVGRSALQEMIAQTQDPRVDVVRIEGDEKELVRMINSFAPTMLHFFCHGTTKPAAYLEVASQATHDLGDQPLYLSQNEIRSVSGSLFLVTLNACEGAAPVPDGHSLALEIANESGVPVVVGMREAIDAQDANLFAGAFYKALLKELHHVLSNPQGASPNWPALMQAPRDRLARRQGGPPLSAAAAHKRWSLPILYMRPEELRIRITGSMEQVRSLQVLRNSRNRLHKETPPEILEEIDQKIAELEAALKLP